jgi:hypothetical protein
MQQDEAVTILEKYQAELEGILSRFSKDREGVHIASDDDGRFRQLVLELRDFFDDHFANGRRYSKQVIAYFNESIQNWLHSPSFRGVENVKSVVVAAIASLRRNPLSLKAAAMQAKARGDKDPDFLNLIAERLHQVIRQLRQRHGGRPTLDVSDEYDVQDLLHALLNLHFNDIRKEEWVPSYGGANSRMDFLLPEIEAVVEIKMMRPNLSTRQLGEELIVDKARYKSHPRCRTLFCVVYDPEGRVANPRGVEADLSEDSETMITRVMIVPK